MVEWDTATDEVWFEILAFSRPHHPRKFASPRLDYSGAQMQSLSRRKS